MNVEQAAMAYAKARTHWLKLKDQRRGYRCTEARETDPETGDGRAPCWHENVDITHEANPLALCSACWFRSMLSGRIEEAAMEHAKAWRVVRRLLLRDQTFHPGFCDCTTCDPDASDPGGQR